MIQVSQNTRIGWIVLIGVFFIGMMGLWSVASVTAEPLGAIVVNHTADIVADDGVCTLREAVIAANRDVPSGTMLGECVAGTIEDEIMVPGGNYTITRIGASEDESATGDLDVIGQVRIIGEGHINIDGGGIDRVFHILPGGNLTMEGVTIRGGRTRDGEPTNTLAVEAGGGILSEGTLIIYESSIISNSTGNGYMGVEGNNGGGWGGDGGGIAHISSGQLRLQNVTISENSTGNGGNAYGDLYNYGGTGGAAGNGGGLYFRGISAGSQNGGYLILDNVLISDNKTGTGGRGGGSGYGSPGQGGAGGSGGGLFIQGGQEVPNQIQFSDIRGNLAGKGGLGGVGSNGTYYGPDGRGGQGGGIRLETDTSVVIDDSAVRWNLIDAGSESHGGGISSSGTLLMRDSIIDGNQAGAGRNGWEEGPVPLAGGYGGGLYQEKGLVSLQRIMISNNVGGKGGSSHYGTAGGHGGGIYAENGEIVILESHIVTNMAGTGGWGGGGGGTGGGLFLNNHALMMNTIIERNEGGRGGSSADSSGGGSGGGMAVGLHGNTTVLQSLLYDNATVGGVLDFGLQARSGDGGGIIVFGDLTLVNSTVSHNRTEEVEASIQFTGDGGGIAGGISSTINIAHSTIVENRTGAIDSKGEVGRGGGIFSAGVMSFTNVLLANNESASESLDCEGSVHSLGYNLIENTTNCILTGDNTGNIFGQDPQLEGIADNGGATRTHALTVNSPAWDAGNCNSEVVTDQRGYPRPIDFPEYPTMGDGCDIGAFEAQGVQVDPNFIAVAEGGIIQSYQVRLMHPPTASVTITLAITNQITVSPTDLVFDPSNWTLPQTITVQAIDDNDLEDVMVVMIEHTTASSDSFYSGLKVGAVEVEIQDNEVPVLPTPTPSPTATQTPIYSPTATPTSTVVPSSTPTSLPPTFTPIITPSSTVSATTTPGGNPHRVQYLPLIRR